MSLLLIFAVVLLASVLVSEWARRSVLSTAVLFLAAGLLLGDGFLGVLHYRGGEETVKQVAEVTLFAVLFKDGMRVGLADLTAAWRLPGRALILGFPLSMVAVALLAKGLTDLSWTWCFLLGAVLAPTDPVFAAAIVGREDVPARLRHLLNVESGLNDGLALPFVVALLGVLGAPEGGYLQIAEELALGVGVGIALPWAAVMLERTRVFSAARSQAALFAVAMGLAVYAVTDAIQGNLFLAAFAAGITVRSLEPRLTEAFRQVGEVAAEVLELLALLLFGALISPPSVRAVGWEGWVFAVAVLLAARPLTLGLSLMGSDMDRAERVAAAWFGPKGFASVVYALLIHQAALSESDEVFHLAAVTIALSIVAHSSTDVLVAKWFRTRQVAASEQSRAEDREADVEARAAHAREDGGH